MIEEMLINYREHKALKCFKERDISCLEVQLEYANQEHKEDELECIKGMQMAANVIEKDRPQRSNKFSSKTENTTFNYAEESKHVTEIDILSIKKKIEKLNKELLQYVDTVETVDIALTILDEKEKLAIEYRYFKGYTDSDISKCFIEKYQEGVRETLNRIINKSIKKMDNFLKKAQ